LRDALEEFVTGVSKPGLIIDGQHRVFGAKNVSDFEVRVPVILLPGLSYQEQVFHFYVLNNKAKPLSKTELRTIVSTSLGNREIDALYDRFKQVGVTAEQTEWTHRMNNEKSSPFHRLINMGLAGSSGPIPESVAHQVASKFLALPSRYKLLTHNVPEWHGDNKYDYRLKVVFAFWSAIRSKYPSAWTNAAQGGNKQIMQKVSLVNLQQHLLEKLHAAMPRRKAKNEASPFADTSVLIEEVKYELEFLSEEFFTKEWRLKGLDTSDGHKIFIQAIADAINSQSANLGNMRLFKASK
jgi:DGQHR domain-containing protein